MLKNCIWVALLSTFGCTLPAPEGGNNGNDRTSGGEQGEALFTGAMIVASSGKWAVMQRNQTSVLFDVEKRSAREMPAQVTRFVFARSGNHGVAMLADHRVVAYDLNTLEARWDSSPAFEGALGASLLRLSEDDEHLVIGDGAALFVLDAATGAVRERVELRSTAAELSFVPGTRRALVVGTTRWLDHQPLTEVTEVDLVSLAQTSIDVPNCTAPIEVLPDASRALLSPTFCEEGAPSVGQRTWTNPDPVSVIDLTPEGPSFLKNLPGFGPVALDPSRDRAIAYLDMERVDPSLFDDPSQVPSLDGPRYYVMSIDARGLGFELFPVGDVLPRFALARDGATLLVDATVQRIRAQAEFKASIDSSGHVNLSFSVFGKNDSLFGALDLSTGTYTPFSGAAASLDRFVQMADAERVFTLKTRLDGMGGDLYRIDLPTGTTTSLGRSLRDIGLLADGRTLLLRERLPAAQVQTNAEISWYRRERYCLSFDGVRCEVSVDFQDRVPFKKGPRCDDYHDC